MKAYPNIIVCYLYRIYITHINLWCEASYIGYKQKLCSTQNNKPQCDDWGLLERWQQI